MSIRVLCRPRTSLPSTCIRRTRITRGIVTLPNNPNIYIFPDNRSLKNGHMLSLLPTDPPKPQLAVGFTTSIPPTADSLTENPAFLTILQSIIGIHAHEDPDIQSQAQAMASTGGSNLGSGGSLFPQQRRRRRSSHGGGPGGGGDGAGGANSQGGIGGAGRGSHIHVYDYRHPPDFGRIPDPEDIFGSLEVDGQGRFVDGHGNYQTSGTYRMCTRDGILGLSPFLHQKLVERLRLEEEMLR